MNIEKKIPVWPGPCALVPMATDVLLIGEPDRRSQTDWSLVKDNYFNLWMQLDQPAPFGKRDSPPKAGAHLMWTLPYAMRSGGMGGDSPDKVDFPDVPNRWLITRFTYEPGTPGQLPVVLVNAVMIKSDELFDLGSDQAKYSQYPDPHAPDFLVRGIGKTVALENWKGAMSSTPPFLKAVGPGDVGWSVGYDNVANVFAFHDPLRDQPGMFSYSLVGWYEDPASDLLKGLPGTGPKAWKIDLEQKIGWSLGIGEQPVEAAISDWLFWQEAHGLQGVWDPDQIHLPPQAKQAIVAWHDWQQAHGINIVAKDLPVNTVVHSMIATVNWRGSNFSYGTGAPGNGKAYPAVAVGNNAVEAISAFMAHQVAKNSQADNSQVPVIERVLEAFQHDLLFDLGNDPVKVEMQLHGMRFSSARSGQQWLVTRPESTGGTPTKAAGQQTVPLDDKQTQHLIRLNRFQTEAYLLDQQQQTLRSELFMLGIKKQYLKPRSPEIIKTKVLDSIKAIQTALSNVKKAMDLNDQAIKEEKKQLEEALGQLYILKLSDTDLTASPNDPVIMVAGSQQDTKLLPPPAEYELLFIRVTGQTVTAIEVSFKLQGEVKTLDICATDLLASVQMPGWNAIPKEVMDLWVELLLLDTSNAGMVAYLYFLKRGDPYSPADLAALTTQIKKQQTAIWNNFKKLGCTAQDLATVSGFQGIVPDAIGVAFRQGQPWTPIFMDWKLRWYPTSSQETGQFKDWQLGDIDYEWTGTHIPIPANALIFQGRTTLNPSVAKNIQYKFAQYTKDPNYEHLPPYLLQDLKDIAENIGKYDMLTQSMSGFTKQLATQLINMNLYPKDLDEWLSEDANGFMPVAGEQSQNASLPFFPIRSGHFQVIDLWVVDAYGQILRGKDPKLGPQSPIPDIYWSESIQTGTGDIQSDKKTYGQLPPRLVQPAKANLSLLKSDDDHVLSNSSDATSSICGWILANHLNNSLVVFDAAGNNQGEVIKVQRETGGGQVGGQVPSYTIRWDAVPGSNVILGAGPSLPNEHLQAFVTNLLKTSLFGSGAFDSLMEHVDSTLWTMSNFTNQNANLSVLLGRPLAVVRGQASLSVAGYPVYNQSWIDTGKHYDAKGSFAPSDPAFMKASFTVRVGDSQFQENGLIGYFEADDYQKFYSVYGVEGETRGIWGALSGGDAQSRALAVSQLMDRPKDQGDPYVETGHLLNLPPGGSRVKLTMIIDPSGAVPLIPGSLPYSMVYLPAGPVSAALANLTVSFRAGPLLLDPESIKMPSPAEVKGKWSWRARQSVTSWNEEAEIVSYTPIAALGTAPLTLTEGWMTLHETFKKNEQK